LKRNLNFIIKVHDAVVGSEYCSFSLHMISIHFETWLLISGHVHNNILEAHILFAIEQHNILAFLAVQGNRMWL
jgi:hypothetical protein